MCRRIALAPILLFSIVLHSVVGQLVINELNADNPGTDTAEFIELYNGGRGNKSLDDYQLVLFNGNDMDRSYLVLNLTDKTTSGSGYFVIGTAGVSPPVNLLLPQSANFLQNGADAAALYNKSVQGWTKGMPASRKGLVDAIVYSKSTTKDKGLLAALLPPGQVQLHENDDLLVADESLSRCQCCQTLNSSVFRLSKPTPGSSNDCNFNRTAPVTPEITSTTPGIASITPAPTAYPNYTVCQSKILINEINSDSPSLDDAEFIELYDGGVGNVDLSGHVLVLFNGRGDYSYLTVPLTGYKTDGNGYFLLGSVSLDPDIAVPVSTIQNGPDAVAVYIDSPNNFPNHSPPTSKRLVDVVVYGTRDKPARSLLSKLQLTNQVDEDFKHHQLDESISRCNSQAQIHPESFILSNPTPRGPNNCTGFTNSAPPPPVIKKKCQVFGCQSLLDTSSKMLINEVITDQDMFDDVEFVELFDGGKGSTSLNNYTLYVVNGSSLEMKCVSLSGHQTNSYGYFVIGTPSVKPTPSLVWDVPDTVSGAVALYSNQKHCLSFLSVQNLVDAIVFGQGRRTNNLLRILAPSENDTIVFNPLDALSITRTGSTRHLNFSSFSLRWPTPGQPYPTSTLVINEVNSDTPGEDVEEFLELFDGGVGNTTLDGFIVVFFNGNRRNDGSYLTIDLRGRQTNSNGFFVIGTAAVTPTPDLIQRANFLQNGVDAIAIYRASASSFPDASQPTRKDLVDAIVYGRSKAVDRHLMNVFLPNQTQAYENPNYIYNGDETLGRCQCCQVNNVSLYKVGRPTPGDVNDCTLVPLEATPSPDYAACKFGVLINEINADQDSNSLESTEFIELYDGGRGNVALDGLVLVLFNGNWEDRSYLTIPLTGYKTDRNGYFLLGSRYLRPFPDLLLDTNMIQNGPDGIALYLDSPSSFPKDTVATFNNIVDAVVYGTNDYPDYSLMTKLLPTLHQVNEDWEHHAGEESISRCFSLNQLHPESFQLSPPTPRRQNNCSGKEVAPVERFAHKNCSVQHRSELADSSLGILINEVGASDADDITYVELYDGGRGGVNLSGVAVYVFSSMTKEVVYCWLLSSLDVTNGDGYFVVYKHSFDLYAGAVAVYANQQDSRCRSYASVDGLVDAVVFENGPQADSLITLFLPKQRNYFYRTGLNYSVSRCTVCFCPSHNQSYELTVQTPGKENACHKVVTIEATSAMSSRVSTETIVSDMVSPGSLKSSDEGLPPGAVVGIVLTLIIVAALVFVGVSYYRRRKVGKSEASFSYKKEDDYRYETY